jgi:hypothetical protein
MRGSQDVKYNAAELQGKVSIGEQKEVVLKSGYRRHASRMHLKPV